MKIEKAKIMGKVAGIISNNFNDEVMFGFDEDFDVIGDNIIVSGYAYFSYDYGMQMYIPDPKEVIIRLKKDGKYESRVEKAKEIYGKYAELEDADIVSADDWFDYMERAKYIEEKLRGQENITVEIDDDGEYMINVGIEIKVPIENFEVTLDRCMDEVKDAICEAKYGR